MDEEIRKIQNPNKYYLALEKLKSGKTKIINPKNKKLILKFLEDAELGRTILKGQKKKIQPGRLHRMLGLLLNMDHLWFKKPFDEVNEDDMNYFVLNLERGIIKSNRGKPYTWETQSTIKKFIRKYYKYLFGENQFYPRLVQFIDTSTRIPEIKAISKDECDKLIGNTSKLTYRFMIAVLFDSGARIEEFYNLKQSDFSKTNEVYKIRIRISKSRPRTINLPLYSAIISEYFKANSFQPNEFVFKPNYGTIRKYLNRLGKELLSKNISPHTLRHGSATYYANFVSRYQLCYRYGWAASSKMPDRYIDMNGLVDDEVVLKITGTKIVKTEKENKELKSKLDVMNSTMLEMIQKQEELEKQVEIRRLEGSVLSETWKEEKSDSELFAFLKDRKDVVKSLKQIMELLDK